MKPEQFCFYEAEVNVKNKATLRPDANLIDGDIIKVNAAWIMEDSDPFSGQFAFIRERGYWIPEEDLILLREISFEEYQKNI